MIDISKYVDITSGVAASGGVSSTGAGSNTPLSITGTPGIALVNVPYRFTPSVYGGFGDRVFTLTGSLPAGLSFDTATGEISGRPTSGGTSSGLAITVTDTTSSATLVGLSITVMSASVAALKFNFPSNSQYVGQVA